jgi:hypothetical protein
VLQCASTNEHYEHKGAFAMRQREYELRKQKLDEQLREGIELLQAAHRHQLRALELVWQMAAEEPGEELEPEPSAAVPPAPAEPPSPPRRSTWEVAADLDEALVRVPEVFDRNDLCAVLGYEPDRNVLYRALQQALIDGRVRREEAGSGQRSTKYRRLRASGSPPEA